MMADVDSRNM